jgi:hypothetical protein
MPCVRCMQDEDGQVELEQPVRYMAIGNTTLSLTSAKDSESIADLKKMEVIIVTHTKTVDDKLRLRTRRGWGSAIRSSDSTTLMIVRSIGFQFSCVIQSNISLTTPPRCRLPTALVSTFVQRMTPPFGWSLTRNQIRLKLH